MSEELTNRKLLPLPWVTAEFQLGRGLVFSAGTNSQVSDYYYQNDVFSISMYQRITRTQEFLCDRRGYYRIKSMDLISSNMLVTDKLVHHIPCGAELVVYPRLIDPVGLDFLFRNLYGDIEVRRFTNPDPFAFRGLREYQRGDDFRNINFKATAKSGQMMVNVNSATASQELMILLNLEEYSAWSNEDVFEDAIRIAASAAGHFADQGLAVGLSSNGLDAATGIPVGVLPGSGEAHFTTMLEQLGRIDLKQKDIRPFSETMSSLKELEPVYLLISSYDRDDIVDAYRDMREQGMTVRWVVPALRDSRINIAEDDFITRWEVVPHASTASRNPEAAR
jgi:uncharacterized protein (DUF58 family)